MSFWLRKAKSTIGAKGLAVVESPLSLEKRASQHGSVSSVSDFRRRLTRRLSTLSLRGRNRHGVSVSPLSNQRNDDNSSSCDTITQGTLSKAALLETVHNIELAKDEPPLPRPKDLKLENDTVKIMASETSSPPIPFIRLKEIATEACDSVLSSISSYTHASTESWNTSIINTILAQLVKESSSGGSQPQWKFIVNSTIIQHAPSLGSDEGDVSGRRGMHSASGAFWNNEKDGMWSFKYAAAEGKGLDVVVGVNWIWVG